jgi:cytoskeletal protein RodZ
MIAMDDDRTTSRRLNGLGLTALWLGAAAVAVGVGFGAVRMVGDKVSDEIPTPLSAGRVAELTATPPDPGSPAASASQTGQPSATGTTPTATATTPTRRRTTAPLQTRRAENKAPAAPRQVTSTRTARATGGTVAVRCTGNSVSLLYARPDDGYAGSVQSRGPVEVEVEFESSGNNGGNGRVKARCSGGTATVEVRNR